MAGTPKRRSAAPRIVSLAFGTFVAALVGTWAAAASGIDVARPWSVFGVLVLVFAVGAAVDTVADAPRARFAGALVGGALAAGIAVWLAGILPAFRGLRFHEFAIDLVAAPVALSVGTLAALVIAVLLIPPGEFDFPGSLMVPAPVAVGGIGAAAGGCIASLVAAAVCPLLGEAWRLSVFAGSVALGMAAGLLVAFVGAATIAERLGLESLLIDPDARSVPVRAHRIGAAAVLGMVAATTIALFAAALVGGAAILALGNPVALPAPDHAQSSVVTMVGGSPTAVAVAYAAAAVASTAMLILVWRKAAENGSLFLLCAFLVDGDLADEALERRVNELIATLQTDQAIAHKLASNQARLALTLLVLPLLWTASFVALLPANLPNAVHVIMTVLYGGLVTIVAFTISTSLERDPLMIDDLPSARLLGLRPAIYRAVALGFGGTLAVLLAAGASGIGMMFVPDGFGFAASVLALGAGVFVGFSGTEAADRLLMAALEGTGRASLARRTRYRLRESGRMTAPRHRRRRATSAFVVVAVGFALAAAALALAAGAAWVLIVMSRRLIRGPSPSPRLRGRTRRGDSQ